MCGGRHLLKTVQKHRRMHEECREWPSVLVTKPEQHTKRSQESKFLVCFHPTLVNVLFLSKRMRMTCVTYLRLVPLQLILQASYLLLKRSFSRAKGVPRGELVVPFHTVTLQLIYRLLCHRRSNDTFSINEVNSLFLTELRSAHTRGLVVGTSPCG